MNYDALIRASLKRRRRDAGGAVAVTDPVVPPYPPGGGFARGGYAPGGGPGSVVTPASAYAAAYPDATPITVTSADPGSGQAVQTPAGPVYMPITPISAPVSTPAASFDPGSGGSVSTPAGPVYLPVTPVSVASGCIILAWWRLEAIFRQLLLRLTLELERAPYLRRPIRLPGLGRRLSPALPRRLPLPRRRRSHFLPCITLLRRLILLAGRPLALRQLHHRASFRLSRRWPHYRQPRRLRRILE